MAWRKKSKKNVPIVPISEDEVNAIEEKVQDLVKTQLPLGRVKKIVRLNPDVEMLNAEALQMMTKSAELFIKELSNAANQNALTEKRKTIQPKDIDKAIKKMWEFAFLEDALDGWPKMQPKKRKPNSSQDETVAEETIVEEEEHEEEHDEEHDDDAVVEALDDVAEEEVEEDELPETVPDEVVENDDQPPLTMKDSFAEQF
ncbi:Protein CBG20898 [Caenorhabditis briggsae]|uniref:Protein CBG20898 n=2 Tax=Caenorhabditis briggsae TaxID=6238 RepID=A8XYW5_CAEBR|nr:Protein CBG20898 [Caenorhabditis briggsae]ULU07657.1 hypothetical protein L3Y34_018987 [Caenorhabditis briggsae]CAP37832.1 Protein CBG20898 [Caenorhabditis briggsae]